jgi:cell wall-associated NlpC family hydrolase
MSPFAASRRRSLVVVILATAVACTPTETEGQKRPLTVISKPTVTLRDSVVLMAKKQLGRRYQLGGDTPKEGFDCSGLVKYVMAALNLDLPRTADLQAKQGLSIKRDTSRLLPGDLLTFGQTSKSDVSHIGIYVGSGRYIHASSVAGRVIESPISRPPAPAIKIWRGARRMLALDSAVPSASAASIPRIPRTTPKRGVN